MDHNRRFFTRTYERNNMLAWLMRKLGYEFDWELNKWVKIKTPPPTKGST